jgi:large-conductance mechanosensitive channel
MSTYSNDINTNTNTSTDTDTTNTTNTTNGNANLKQDKNKVWMDQLNKFLVDNDIVGTAAGVSIALATKDVIQSLVSDIIIPGIIFLLLKLNIVSLTKFLMMPGKTKFDCINFIKQFITWIFIIVITYIFVKVAFEGLLGVKG